MAYNPIDYKNIALAIMLRGNKFLILEPCGNNIVGDMGERYDNHNLKQGDVFASIKYKRRESRCEIDGTAVDYKLSNCSMDETYRTQNIIKALNIVVENATSLSGTYIARHDEACREILHTINEMHLKKDIKLYDPQMFTKILIDGGSGQPMYGIIQKNMARIEANIKGEKLIEAQSKSTVPENKHFSERRR